MSCLALGTPETCTPSQRLWEVLVGSSSTSVVTRLSTKAEQLLLTSLEGWGERKRGSRETLTSTGAFPNYTRHCHTPA